MRATLAARVALGLVALLVVGWLAVLEVGQRARTRALDQAVARDFPAADASFREAGRLNPDTEPDVLRALVDGARGDRARAAAGLEVILRREPENLAAWTDLLPLVRTSDPVRFREARAAIRRLDPLRAGARTAPPRPRDG